MGIALSEADQADAADRMEKWLEARFGRLLDSLNTSPLPWTRIEALSQQTKRNITMSSAGPVRVLLDA